jgi:hypothetical protein
MTVPYTVKPGDYLSLIAKRHNLKSWKDIYYHPDNAAFRAKRPNPDLIHPGDVVYVPGDAGPAQPAPPGKPGSAEAWLVSKNTIEVRRIEVAGGMWGQIFDKDFLKKLRRPGINIWDVLVYGVGGALTPKRGVWEAVFGMFSIEGGAAYDMGKVMSKSTQVFPASHVMKTADIVEEIRIFKNYLKLTRHYRYQYGPGISSDRVSVTRKTTLIDMAPNVPSQILHSTRSVKQPASYVDPR